MPVLRPMKKERSRSFPVLDLGTAYEVLVRRLAGLGTSKVERDALAEILGYSSAGGGIAARKISALVQYGMLDYRDGLYELSSRAHRLQSFKVGTGDFLAAVRVALEKPALFRSILSRYRSVGRIPEDLAQVLTDHYGITARASEEAETVFVRSAMFAEVLDAEGRFREIGESPVSSSVEPLPSPQSGAEGKMLPGSPAPSEEGYPLPITGRRYARLILPPSMSAKDLEMLEQGLLFDIKSGVLWDHLGIEKPGANPAQSATEKQDPASTDNVIPIDRSGKPKL
jgi:hypothetical protein